MTRNYALNPRFTLPFVFLLIVSLLFLLPGGSLQAQQANQFFTYPENGTDPVATFTASDPEGDAPIVWSLPGAAVDDTDVMQEDVADNEDFKIDQNGVLSFIDSPDYEVPVDAAPADNQYRVTVQASDGDNDSYYKVYVNVTNVQETGKVTWTVDPNGEATDDVPDNVVLRQFQPGAVLTASVTDPDATAAIASANVTWKWYRGDTEIDNPSPDKSMYTVQDGDAGNNIRVTGTYSDGTGGPRETVSLTSETTVQAFRRANGAPSFVSTINTRRIAENSSGNIGGPVAATDPNGDTLTYAINDGTDGASFGVNPATGQLMTGPGLMIDFEDANNTDDSYTVAVTAYDSFGAPTVPVATVVINVIDVDEAPTFDDVDTTTTPPENVMRAVHTEDEPSLDIAVYMALDPEDENVTLSLMGDDAGSFELNDPDPAASGTKVLAFKENPDFEMPGDRDQDNLYEVTVRASDGTLTAGRMMVVKVTNAIEDGKVTVTPETALIGVELTASITDPEGGVAVSGQITGERWTWQAGTSAIFEANAANNIPNATSSTYTPVSGNEYLRAMVTYTYQGGAEKTGVSDVVSVQTSRENDAPRFADGASALRVVAENTAGLADADSNLEGDDIGSPIDASDANNDTPTYTLSGSDASNFNVRTDGQLEVKEGAELDHETKARHTVTLIANDGSGESNATASIAVTIYVTDVDEAPKISGGSDSEISYRENSTGRVATFSASDPEGAAPVVWALTAEPVTNEVAQEDIDDDDSFAISQSGVLTFMASPSYEPRDDNDYRVTVQASDGTQTGYSKVTVNVTDIEETGTVTVSVNPGTGIIMGLQQFMPTAVLTASVTDPDAVTSSVPTGLIADVTWKWYRSGREISGATEANYTVHDDDVGKRVRATATYNDGAGPQETRSWTSGASVQGARQTNSDPSFAATAVSRRIAENSTGNIGAPITATDSDGDTLVYAITGGGDGDLFRVNPATGQLMTGPGLMIDFEDATNNPDNMYAVEVTAYDSSGAATVPAAMVRIDVNDVDEMPTFNEIDNVATPMRATLAEDADAADLNVATYDASDPEDKNVTLSLMGDDAGLFELADDTNTGNVVRQVLAFKENPDFEMPGDRDQDNLYEVTVRASDGTLTADRMMVVKVTNAIEDGKVTVTPETALIGVELTASLTDLEGGVAASGQITGERWTWHNSDDDDDFEAGTENAIENATSSTYTPVSGNQYLRAMVAYTYQGGAVEKTGVSDVVSVQISRENHAPRFADGASAFRVVAENTAGLADADPNLEGDDIGSPIDASDANDDTLTYTLSGPDASNFDVRSDSGQLEVKEGAELDHEMKASHSVTLMANDGSGDANATASIAVTIYVTDVDEAPEITVGDASIDLSISGAASPLYAENSVDAVETYTLTGTNAASATWSLEGADAGDFTISGGMLRFVTSPNYEMPADANEDNIYMVTVKASDADGTDVATHEVTVTVTDVAEVPTTISGSSNMDYAENDTRAVATYTVSGPDAASAIWSLEGADAGDFTISGGMLRFVTSPDYEMPADANEDNTYMVTVTANDATYDVTIMVTDVDEVPTIAGDATIDYAENGTGAVATYTAMDPDGTAISWSLDGDDADVFDIAGGVLTFKESPDYENPTDVGIDNTYMVTVTANDATYEVVIMVTDVNEALTAISGPSNTDYAENRTDDVATFISMDPEGATISWTLEGTDAGVFDISSGGVLTFRSSPDYEMPADADTDNIYMVTVNASDGTHMASHEVTVTVTNVDDTIVEQTLLERYDADGDDDIDLTEVSTAIDDFFSGGLTLAEVSAVIDLFFE